VRFLSHWCSSALAVERGERHHILSPARAAGHHGKAKRSMSIAGLVVASVLNVRWRMDNA